MQKFHDFLREVERRERPGYVLAGSETFLRDEAERAVVRAVFGEADPGAGLVTLDGRREGEALELADVFDELRGVSLFATRKVVSVRRADDVAKGRADAFVAYLDDPDPDSVLVLHVESWDKRAAYARKYGDAAVDCSTPYETAYGETEISARSPLGNWLLGRARRAYGLSIGPDAAVRLMELVGGNLAELDGALKTLAVSRPGREGGASVSRKLVEETVEPSRSYTQFRVAELAIAGRAKDAFAAAEACFELGLSDAKGRVRHREDGIAESIIWAVAHRLERLYAVRGLIEEGSFSKSEAGRLGIPPFQADAVARAARAMPLETIANALELAFAVARSTRGEADPRFAVEKLILGLGDLIGTALPSRGG